MRILYLNPDRGVPVLGDKGASVHVREFVAALTRAGHEVAVVAARAGEGNPPPPGRLIELTRDGAAAPGEAAARGLPESALDSDVVRNELLRLAYDRTLAARVLSALAEAGFAPDLVYERHALFHSAGVEVARTFGAPRMLEVNAPLLREQEMFRQLALKPAAVEAERASFAGAERVIAVSEEVAAYARAGGVGPAHVLVIPNGVDTDLFNPGAGGQLTRVSLGLGDAPVLGFVGSFKPWHGVGFLIEAFAEMAQRRPDLRLLAIGDGPEHAQAKARIAELGLGDRVILTGRLPYAEVPAHLAAMDVSAAPYTLDGEFYFSPLKVVESLAAGVPVIAARAGQLVSLIEHGRTGLLYPPGDRAGFVDACLGLVADKKQLGVMSQNAREQAARHHSWDGAVLRVLDEAARLSGERRAA